jgi:hypothetical protein
MAEAMKPWMNEEKIPKRVLKAKIRGNCTGGKLRSWWGQQIRKDIKQKKKL